MTDSDIMSVESAWAALKAASEAYKKVISDKFEAERQVQAEHGPKVHAAKATLSAAERAHASAVAAATPDHPLHGRRVFKMEKTYASFGYRPIGEKRVDGIILTYRPGDKQARWGAVKVGDPIVAITKKDGTPSLNGREAYDEKAWRFETQALPA